MSKIAVSSPSSVGTEKSSSSTRAANQIFFLWIDKRYRFDLLCKSRRSVLKDFYDEVTARGYY